MVPLGHLLGLGRRVPAGVRVGLERGRGAVAADALVRGLAARHADVGDVVAFALAAAVVVLARHSAAPGSAEMDQADADVCRILSYRMMIVVGTYDVL